MFNDLTLGELLAQISSNQPTPGGGVVAALAGQFSASLIIMVCNLTLNKKGYEKVQQKITRYLHQAQTIKETLKQLAEDDQDAFNSVMSAYKSRKDDPLKSNEQLILSLKAATLVPSKVRKNALVLKRIAQKIALIGNINAYSDAMSAVYLAEASAKSALENIKINQKSLRSL